MCNLSNQMCHRYLRCCCLHWNRHNGIAQAVSDCGGASSKCAEDIGSTATDLGNLSALITKMVDDCASSDDLGVSSKCEGEIIQAGSLAAKVTTDILAATSDCSSSEQTFVQ